MKHKQNMASADWPYVVPIDILKKRRLFISIKFCYQSKPSGDRVYQSNILIQLDLGTVF